MNSSRNAVFTLYSHLVFVTKYRRRVFYRYHLVEMEAIFTSVCNELGASLDVIKKYIQNHYTPS